MPHFCVARQARATDPRLFLALRVGVRVPRVCSRFNLVWIGTCTKNSCATQQGQGAERKGTARHGPRDRDGLNAALLAPVYCIPCKYTFFITIV